MKLSRTILCFATVAASAVGCGSSDTSCPDGGCADSAVTVADGGLGSDAGGDGPMQWGLSRGTNDYNVTNVTVGDDGCMEKADLMSLVGMAVTVTYDEPTATISVGKLKGAPMQAAFGSGKVAGNNAPLTRDNQAGDPAGCYWHQTDMGPFALFDHDKFTVDLTETLNMFATACAAADVPMGGTCTTKFQLTFAKK
jgi:hypothetical protein